MPKLEDGSEFGLKGHFKEDFSHRTRVGLAPRAGHVDRDAPYKRIATEEAWTFPALVKAQVEYAESGDAPGRRQPAHGGDVLEDAKPAGDDAGPRRAAPRHMDEYGIDRQLLLLTAPGVQVRAPGRRHRAGARGQRHRCRSLPPTPRPVLAPARRSIRAMSPARSRKSSGR